MGTRQASGTLGRYPGVFGSCGGTHFEPREKLMATSFQNLVQGGTAQMGVLFPMRQPEFLVRQPSIEINTRWAHRTNDELTAAPRSQVAQPPKDVLVRLPSLSESKWKVRVLQRWTGRVEYVGADTFSAVINDATNSKNPPEQVELDLNEVSPGDLSLVAQGASFYWSMGYCDTPGGQRERISALRFARRPRLSRTEVNRILEQADQLAALLESD